MDIKRNSNLNHNLASYQLFANSYKGGRWIKNPPSPTYDPSSPNFALLPNGSYLVPFTNETLESFQSRKRRASYRNLCQEIIRVYSATLFAQGYAIDREAIKESLNGIYDDIDLAGTSAESFIRKAFEEALIYGWVLVFTDTPKQETTLSSYDESLNNIRPYSRIIVPPNVWDWKLDPENQFEEILIDEGNVNGVPTWLRITKQGYQYLDQDGKIILEGDHGFDRIPVDILICDEPSMDHDDEPFGHSALRDVSDLAIELYNKASELEDLLRKTNFPVLHVAKDIEGSSPPSTLPLSSDSAIWLQGDINWVSPDIQAISQCRQHCLDLEQQIRHIAGISTRSEESTEAHSGAALRWEYSTRLSLVKLRAEQLRQFETRLWKTYSEILGIDIPWQSVRYPSDYVEMIVPEAINQLKSLVEIKAPISVLKSQLRQITLCQFRHRPNLSEILDSIEEWNPYVNDSGDKN